MSSEFEKSMKRIGSIGSAENDSLIDRILFGESKRINITRFETQNFFEWAMAMKIFTNSAKKSVIHLVGDGDEAAAMCEAGVGLSFDQLTQLKTTSVRIVLPPSGSPKEISQLWVGKVVQLVDPALVGQTTQPVMVPAHVFGEKGEPLTAYFTTAEIAAQSLEEEERDTFYRHLLKTHDQTSFDPAQIIVAFPDNCLLIQS